MADAVILSTMNGLKKSDLSTGMLLMRNLGSDVACNIGQRTLPSMCLRCARSRDAQGSIFICQIKHKTD